MLRGSNKEVEIGEGGRNDNIDHMKHVVLPQDTITWGPRIQEYVTRSPMTSLQSYRTLNWKIYEATETTRANKSISATYP